MRRERPIAALFFLSGMSGLVYEVAWVRQLGNLFGNTVLSASMVAAVFMAGLGIGSFGAGAWSDRRARESSRVLLSSYGVVELLVAACAVALAVGLPHLGAIVARVATYSRDAHGWFEPSVITLLLRGVLATVLLLPPTLLMGATFTLLVRHAVVRDVHAGRSVGVLYGWNTAGAATGALLTDLVFVPELGLLRTQLLAASLQVLVGIVAILLARNEAPAPLPEEQNPSAAPLASGHRAFMCACVALFLSGFAALGMEMVWFRGLSVALGSFRPVFSIVLAVLLFGIMVGSLLGGWMTVRFLRPLSVFVVTQALLGASALVVAGGFSPVGTLAPSAVVETVARLILVPSLLLGFSMPIVNALVQDARDRVGVRVGGLYLANTLGSVAGSLVAGFALAPHLGIQESLGIFAACAALAPLPLVFANLESELPKKALVAWAALSIPLLAAWFALPATYLLSRFMPKFPADERVLALQEGVSEVVVVTEGDQGPRSLVTNGHRMSATTLPAQRYMRAFVHIPMLMMDHPSRVLVICFGVGNTLNAASLYDSVTELELADLSKNVLEHASYFAGTNGDVIADPRLSVFVDDGRAHLRAVSEGRYDLITLEPPPIRFAGVSSLYSREFYDLARSRLKEGGYMSQWLPLYQIPGDTVLELVRAFVDVFPGAALMAGSGEEFMLVGKRGGPVTFDLDHVERALWSLPKIELDLAHVHMGTLVELAGAFVADDSALREATASASPLTDDRPDLEYTMWRAPSPPSGLVALEGIHGYCIDCYVDGQPDVRLSALDEYLEAQRRQYAKWRLVPASTSRSH